MIVRSSRVVLPDGERPAVLQIERGTVVRITDGPAAPADSPDGDDHDFGDLVVSPGLVDTHVHVNEPGRTDWEGFDTATRAAAAGGVTTIVDMPLNSIPATTTPASLEIKRGSARGRIHVDVAFWGGVVPGNTGELNALVDAGVRGFKCFLAPSGVDEFAHVSEADLHEAMPILARRGVPLLVHAEDPAHLRPSVHSTFPTSSAYSAYLATRPPEAEVAAVELMVRLARACGTRVHIVHVTSAEAVDVIARAKSRGVAISAETCPHYLTFSAEEIDAGATEFKCAPPIRDARHREALWEGIDSGVLDLIASDHSPAPASMKPRGDFMNAWGGIASLELGLRAIALQLKPIDIARTMSLRPARLARLERKGRIAVGCDADLVVWDPDAERRVDPDALQQRHKMTPYAGRTLKGEVRATFVRGALVWQDGSLTVTGGGQLL